jgi:hypothetical protein
MKDYDVLKVKEPFDLLAISRSLTLCDNATIKLVGDRKDMLCQLQVMLTASQKIRRVLPYHCVEIVVSDVYFSFM